MPGPGHLLAERDAMKEPNPLSDGGVSNVVPAESMEAFSSVAAPGVHQAEADAMANTIAPSSPTATRTWLRIPPSPAPPAVPSPPCMEAYPRVARMSTATPQQPFSHGADGRGTHSTRYIRRETGPNCALRSLQARLALVRIWARSSFRQHGCTPTRLDWRYPPLC